MCALPYFIYGPATHLLQEGNLISQPASGDNATLFGTGSKRETNYEVCDSVTDECDKKNHPFNLVAYSILWVASFVNGLGYSTFTTIGLPYLDNNVKKKNSPIYLSELWC